MAAGRNTHFPARQQLRRFGQEAGFSLKSTFVHAFLPRFLASGLVGAIAYFSITAFQEKLSAEVSHTLLEDIRVGIAYIWGLGTTARAHRGAASHVA